MQPGARPSGSWLSTTIAANPAGREGRLVTGYFEQQSWRSTNPDGIRGRAGYYHRPLSVYLNALIAAGFRLDAVLDPRPTRASVRSCRRDAAFEQLFELLLV